MLLHSDQCHLSSERLAQKFNHWVVLLLLQGNLMLQFGVLNLVL